MEDLEQTIVEHLKRLIGFYPASDQQDNVLQLLTYCQQQLAQSGHFADVQIVVHEGVHSLVASTQGTKRPKLLLQGHIDVVPAPEAMRQLVQQGDLLIGRGSFDMLFATACYLTFIEAHQAQLAGLDLGLMLTGDEELGGFRGVQALLEDGYGAEVCILPDAGNGLGSLSVAAKGVHGVTVEIQGQAHHGARPWEGDGAAAKLVEFLHELLQHFDPSDHDNSTATVSILQAGDAMNKGPATARAHIDIRYKDKTDLARITDVLDRLLAKYNGMIVELDEGEDYQLDLENPYVTSFISLYEATVGKPIEQIKAPGSSDARFFSAKGIPVIMLRPKGEGAHADYEAIDRAELLQFYELIETYILQTAKL